MRKNNPVTDIVGFVLVMVVSSVWNISGLTAAADSDRPEAGRNPIVRFGSPASRYLIPLAASLKEAPGDDLSPDAIRTGWSSSFGTYNPGSSDQIYRFRYFSADGSPVVSYLTRPIPPGQNLFTTPEIMACIQRSPLVPDEPCKPEATFLLESGSPLPLVERTYIGYVVVEEVHGGAFVASSWIARGGADLINPVCGSQGNCWFTSFGYNRAAFRVEPAALRRSGRATFAKSIIFPGAYLVSDLTPQMSAELGRQQSASACRPGAPMPAVCVPDFERADDSGVTGLPLGWDGIVSVVNQGSEPVVGSFAFTPHGHSAATIESRSVRLEPGRQLIAAVSDLLAPDLGQGVLDFRIAAGRSHLYGVLFQGDSHLQFFGYGVQGLNIWQLNESGFLDIEGSERETVFPLALNTGGRTGLDSALSLYNPTGRSTVVTVRCLSSSGLVADVRRIELNPGEASVYQLSRSQMETELVGWMSVEASEPVVAKLTVARGGTDVEGYGWQSFAFDVPATPVSSVRSSASLVFLATNESLGYANQAPPVAPHDAEDTHHVNGFDLAVQLLNLDSGSVGVRLAFMRRYVRESDRDDIVWSSRAHTLRPGSSRLLVAGSEFRDLDPEDLRDGMLVVHVVDPRTGLPARARLVGAAVEGDRGFKWFGYSVVGHPVD